MILVESMYFIAPVSTVDKHLPCVSFQIPESLCELSELQSGSVTDNSDEQTGQVPGLKEPTVPWLSLLIGHGHLKAAELWEEQPFYEWAVDKASNEINP